MEAGLAELTEAVAAILAAHLVAEFNDAVAVGNFDEFLQRVTDDAVVRFERVPGAGTLEFAGREAYTQAYAQRPPDDQLDVTGAVRLEESAAVVPFAWRRDGQAGTMLLTFTRGPFEELDEWLVSAMTVRFD